MFAPVGKILERSPVAASAPCRIDSGGTWDIKALALPITTAAPVTVNIAVNLRTRVTLTPFAEGKVKVSSLGFLHHEEYPVHTMRFDSHFGIFFAALAYFAYHGVEVRIETASPPKAALGGSSTALIALIKALSDLSARLGRPRLAPKEILHLGYHLEDAVSPGKCGVQDHAAAVYGGVNQWGWQYGSTGRFFSRQSLLDSEGRRELSRHILLAYSGTSHVSSRVNQGWIKDFFTGKTRAGWVRVNDIVKELGRSIGNRAWKESARLLREETAVRREITPDAFIPITELLIRRAEETGCGARFTGAGAGGSVWAVGERGRIKALREIWTVTLADAGGGGVLHCEVDPKGVRSFE